MAEELAYEEPTLAGESFTDSIHLASLFRLSGDSRTRSIAGIRTTENATLFRRAERPRECKRTDNDRRSVHYLVRRAALPVRSARLGQGVIASARFGHAQ